MPSPCSPALTAAALAPLGPERLLPPAPAPRRAGLLAVSSVIRDERIRSGLPAACDQCGASAVRLVPILYGRAAQPGLGATFTTGAVWWCQALPRGSVGRVGTGASSSFRVRQGAGPAQSFQFEIVLTHQANLWFMRRVVSL